MAEKAAAITAKAAANKKILTPEQLAAKDSRRDAQVARVTPSWILRSSWTRSKSRKQPAAGGMITRFMRA